MSQTFKTLFKGGYDNYKRQIVNPIIFPKGPSEKGKYGLCLIKFRLSKEDTLKNILVYSTTDSLYANQIKKLLLESKKYWKTSTLKTPINCIVGYNFIRHGDNSNGTLPALSYKELSENLIKTGMFDTKYETEPCYFLGVDLILGYIGYEITE